MAAPFVSPYSQIPAGISQSFTGLRTVPFRAFSPVLKLSDAGKLQERILIVTDEVIFVATPDGQIRRGSPMEGLSEIFWHKVQRMLVFVFPLQYDLCVKLDPTYSSIGKDASMRLLGPQLSALEDDWPRLAVLIGRLRERRVLGCSGNGSGAALKYTSAVGEAANRAFRLKKPDGQFQPILRTGAASALLALPEEEIVLRVAQAEGQVDRSTASADETIRFEDIPGKLGNDLENPHGDELPDTHSGLSLETSAKMSPIRWTAAAGECLNDSPAGDVFTQQLPDREDRKVLCETSKLLSKEPGARLASRGSDPVNSINARPAVVAGEEYEILSYQMLSTTTPQGGEPARSTETGTQATARSSSHVEAAAPFSVVVDSTSNVESEYSVELSPTQSLAPAFGSVHGIPTAGLEQLSSPTPVLTVPDPSTARHHLMTGSGSITIGTGSACSSILEFVMNVEKERDWYAAQAEAAHAEAEKLRAELVNAKMEVLWYRQRFLSTRD
jgi:hypothetical protein